MMHKKTFHAIAAVLLLLLGSFSALTGEPVDYHEQYRKKLLERGTQSLAKLRERNQKIITDITTFVHLLAKDKRLEWEFKNFKFETKEVMIDMGEVKLGSFKGKVPEKHIRLVVKCVMRKKPNNKQTMTMSDNAGDKKEINAERSNIDTEGVSERQEAFWQRDLIPYNQLDNMDLFKSAVTAKFGQGRSYDERFALSSQVDIHSKEEIQELAEKAPEITAKFIDCYETTYELPMNITQKATDRPPEEIGRILGLIQRLGLQEVVSLEYQNRNGKWSAWAKRNELRNADFRLVFRFRPFPFCRYKANKEDLGPIRLLSGGEPFPFVRDTGEEVLGPIRELCDEVIRAAKVCDEVPQLEKVFKNVVHLDEFFDIVFHHEDVFKHTRECFSEEYVNLFYSFSVLRAEMLIAEAEYPFYREGEQVEITFTPVGQVARRTYTGVFKRIGRSRISIGKYFFDLNDLPEKLRVRFDAKLNRKAKLDLLKKHPIITRYKNEWETAVYEKTNEMLINQFETNLKMGLVYVDESWIFPEELAENIVRENVNKGNSNDAVWYFRTPNGELDEKDPWKVKLRLLGYAYRSYSRYYSNGWYSSYSRATVESWFYGIESISENYSLREIDGNDIYEYAYYHNLPLKDTPVQNKGKKEEVKGNAVKSGM